MVDLLCYSCVLVRIEHVYMGTGFQTEFGEHTNRVGTHNVGIYEV